MEAYFKQEWIKKAQVSRWRILWHKILHALHIRRIKYFIGVDPAKEGSETCVEGYWRNGIYTITKIH